MVGRIFPVHFMEMDAVPAPSNVRFNDQKCRALWAWIGSLMVLSLVAVPHNLVIAQSRDVSPESVDEERFIWVAEDSLQDQFWEFKDPAGWKFADIDGGRVLSQFLKTSDYQPPHRSPLHIALLKEKKFESFQLDVWVRSTHAEYGHRDVCLFFGYAAPDSFYYVHLASEMDDRANQIFLVNKADRTKISKTTTAGTGWDDAWHHVRVIREMKTGEISIYFDDLDKPVMKAVDKTIGAGQIGFGSFDDTVDFKRLEVRPL